METSSPFQWNAIVEGKPASVMERISRLPCREGFFQIMDHGRKLTELSHVKPGHRATRDNGVTANDVLKHFIDSDKVLNESNEIWWGSIAHGYVQKGEYWQALDAYGRMQTNHISPSKQTFLTIMKACSKVSSIHKAMAVHANIIQQGLEMDQNIGNTIVDMYGKCNHIHEARDVFNELICRDIVSWNALISGYVDNGLCREALECSDQICLTGVSRDAVTFLCSLKACAALGDLKKGQELHAEVIKEGFENHHFLSCTLVDMYAKGGQLFDAREVFDELPNRGVVPWTALISGYADHGLASEALECLFEMEKEGWPPNEVTLVCCLKACGSIRDINKGRQLHREIMQEGFEKNPFINSALVDMYAKCGCIVESRDVFNELPNQDLVSWTALIAGYAEHGQDKEALRCLELMQKNGVRPNVVTLICSLKACGNIGDIHKGQELHLEIVRGELEGNSYAVNALVGMYAKCGLLVDASDVFEDIPTREVISWNAMILGYAEQGEAEKAFTLNSQMQEQGLLPGNGTFVGILKAIGSVQSLDAGKRIHAQVFGRSEEESNYSIEVSGIILSTAFIDMYGKCGIMSSAQQIFDTIQSNDFILWTALITGYTQQGESECVFNLFEMMIKSGVQPNAITFLSLLNVCSHSGLVDIAYMYFELMVKEYGIVPNMKHYNCLLDLLGRAGQFPQAMVLLEHMPGQPGYVAWSTLLAHCRSHGSIELARYAFECALSEEDKGAAMFVLVSNVPLDLFMEEYEEDVELD